MARFSRIGCTAQSYYYARSVFFVVTHNNFIFHYMREIALAVRSVIILFPPRGSGGGGDRPGTGNGFLPPPTNHFHARHRRHPYCAVKRPKTSPSRRFMSRLGYSHKIIFTVLYNVNRPPSAAPVFAPPPPPPPPIPAAARARSLSSLAYYCGNKIRDGAIRR